MCWLWWSCGGCSRDDLRWCVRVGAVVAEGWPSAPSADAYAWRSCRSSFSDDEGFDLANIAGGKISVKRATGHAGHHACWDVIRIKDQQKITVCHTIAAIHTIEVRRQPTISHRRRLTGIVRAIVGKYRKHSLHQPSREI